MTAWFRELYLKDFNRLNKKKGRSDLTFQYLRAWLMQFILFLVFVYSDNAHTSIKLQYSVTYCSGDVDESVSFGVIIVRDKKCYSKNETKYFKLWKQLLSPVAR